MNMTLFEWDEEKYSVGVDEMDEHHKKIIDLINEMHSAMKEGEGNEKVGEILEEMRSYTDYHFKAEERYLEKNDYPSGKLKEQEDQHQKYVEKIEEYQDKIEEGSLSLSMEVMNFLKDWLSNHILEIDMKYKEYFED